MLRIGILAFAVAALGSAIYVLSAEPAQRDLAAQKERRAASKQKTPEPEAAPEDDLPVLPPHEWRSAPIQPGSFNKKAPPPPPPGPGVVKSQDEAVEIYEGFLAELAELEAREGDLTDAQKEKVYRDATTVLAGLSEHFDPDNPDQWSYLNGARGMVMAQLRRMEIGPPDPPKRPPPRVRRRPQ